MLAAPLALTATASQARTDTAPIAGAASPLRQVDTAYVGHLVDEMTLQEKQGLIMGGAEAAATYQGQAGYLPGVPRLHIPSLRLADGPPGVLTRESSQAQPATMAVAATFSAKDAFDNGVIIGRQARALGIDVALQPFINLDRDITFARAYNTFGEDPFLTAEMGAQEIRGIQSQDVMAEAKHFIAYGSNGYNIHVGQQALHEVYLEPFDAAVKAGVASIMCSYNRVNGPFSCGNRYNLQTVLRQELGFKGFVVSDWGATHSATFINDGLDVDMPGDLGRNSPLAAMAIPFFWLGTQPPPPLPPFNPAAIQSFMPVTLPEEPAAVTSMAKFPMTNDHTTLAQLVRENKVSESTIDDAARRVLYEMDRFGYLNGTQKHTVTPGAQDVKRSGAVIRKTADDAAVLLKNDGHILPLSQKSLHSLVVIGPSARQVDSIGLFGERSGGMPRLQVGPYAALRAESPTSQIRLAIADDMTGTPISAEYWSHDGKLGIIDGRGHTASEIDFTVSNGHPLPVNSDNSWRGTLTVPAAGTYWIYLQALGARAKLSVDGKVVGFTHAIKGGVHGDVQHASQDGGFPTTDGLDNVRTVLQLSAGPHPVIVNAVPDGSNRPEQVRLNWMTPQARAADYADAIDAARHAHTAVVFAWSRGKPAFHLPGNQDQLIEQVAKVNPNTIVVLNTSQPVAVPWLNQVKAVVEMWWPGDEGGWATADVLLGKVDPSGHLPFTWAKRLADYAATDPSHPERTGDGVNGVTTYSAGVDIGYRWFAANHIQPLFPFGYGLSYTHFVYAGLAAQPVTGGGVDVSFRVTNDGQAAGIAVPQIYIGAPSPEPAGSQFAPLTLAAFDRVRLAAGQTRQVTLHVARRALQYWRTADHRWITDDNRPLWVGTSATDIVLSDRSIAH